MIVKVLLFAAAKDLADAESVSLETPPGGTIADLKLSLGREYPQLASLLLRCAIARNQEYAEDSDPVASGDELAVIPPVSGG